MVNRSENGFTTVELMVALTLAFVLAGFVYSAAHFSHKLFAQWQKRAQTESAAWLCIQALQKDLLHAQQIIVAEPQALALRSAEQQTISYRLNERRLYRNDECLLSFAIKIDSLTFYYFKRVAVAEQKPILQNPLEVFHPRTPEEFANIALIEVVLTLRGHSAVTINAFTQQRCVEKMHTRFYHREHRGSSLRGHTRLQPEQYRKRKNLV